MFVAGAAAAVVFDWVLAAAVLSASDSAAEALLDVLAAYVGFINWQERTSSEIVWITKIIGDCIVWASARRSFYQTLFSDVKFIRFGVMY